MATSRPERTHLSPKWDLVSGDIAKAFPGVVILHAALGWKPTFARATTTITSDGMITYSFTVEASRPITASL